MAQHGGRVAVDPLTCALRLVRAANERDLVRYHALLDDRFRGEVDGEPVASSADEDGALAARSWAAHPDTRLVVEDAEVAGGFVLLRSRVVDGGVERPATTVLEVGDGRVLRAWRFGAPPAPPARSRWTASRIAATALLVVALVGYTIYDELLLSTPVVVASLALGPLPAFGLFALGYGVAGFGLTLLVLRRYERSLGDRPGRVERWLRHAAGQAHWRWLTRALAAGRVPAFVGASYALGPLVTVWVLRSGGVRHGIRGLAALSTLVWATTFVGGYAGVVALVR